MSSQWIYTTVLYPSRLSSISVMAQSDGLLSWQHRWIGVHALVQTQGSDQAESDCLASHMLEWLYMLFCSRCCILQSWGTQQGCWWGKRCLPLGTPLALTTHSRVASSVAPAEKSAQATLAAPYK